MDKHIAYHELLDTVRDSKGCPLCRLESRSAYRYLDSLLHQSINDPGVRRNLVQSRGFCSRHARQLAEFRNALGAAILYDDQLRSFLGFIDTLPAAPQKRARRPEEWPRAGLCPACRAEVECGGRFAAILASGLEEEEMRSAYSSCSGLCASHFVGVLGETHNADTYRFLISHQRARVDTLLRELQEFQRKHDYRFHHERFGGEGDSWLRAIKLIAGEDDEPKTPRGPK